MNIEPGDIVEVISPFLLNYGCRGEVIAVNGDCLRVLPIEEHCPWPEGRSLCELTVEDVEKVVE